MMKERKEKICIWLCTSSVGGLLELTDMCEATPLSHQLNSYTSGCAKRTQISGVAPNKVIICFVAEFSPSELNYCMGTNYLSLY